MTRSKKNQNSLGPRHCFAPANHHASRPSLAPSRPEPYQPMPLDNGSIWIGYVSADQRHRAYKEFPSFADVITMCDQNMKAGNPAETFPKPVLSRSKEDIKDEYKTVYCGACVQFCCKDRQCDELKVWYQREILEESRGMGKPAYFLMYKFWMDDELMAALMLHMGNNLWRFQQMDGKLAHHYSLTSNHQCRDNLAPLISHPFSAGPSHQSARGDEPSDYTREENASVQGEPTARVSRRKPINYRERSVSFSQAPSRRSSGSAVKPGEHHFTSPQYTPAPLPWLAQIGLESPPRPRRSNMANEGSEHDEGVISTQADNLLRSLDQASSSGVSQIPLEGRQPDFPYWHGGDEDDEEEEEHVHGGSVNEQGGYGGNKQWQHPAPSSALDPERFKGSIHSSQYRAPESKFYGPGATAYARAPSSTYNGSHLQTSTSSYRTLQQAPTRKRRIEMATGYASTEPARPPPARMTTAPPAQMSMAPTAQRIMAPPAQMAIPPPAQRNIAPMAIMTTARPHLATPSSSSLAQRQRSASVALVDLAIRQDAAAHLARILASLFQAYPHAQQLGDVGNVIQQMGAAARRGDVNELLRLHGVVLAALMVAEPSGYMG